MKPNFIRNAAAPCLAVILAGCGGGDDSKERDLSASSLKYTDVGLSISGPEESIPARAGEPTQLTLKIRNDGIKTAQDIRIPALPTAFKLTQDGCSKKPLSPEASCELTIELYAESAGLVNLPLEIRYDYADTRDRVVSTSVSYAVAPSQWLSLAEWGEHNRDARHSGFVPVTLQPAWFKQRWSTTAFTNRVLNPASIGYGKVYLTPGSYAAMANSAIPLTVVSESSGNGHFSPMPRLYSLPKDQTLKVLRLEDGSQAWSYLFEGSPDGKDVSYMDNILYVSPAAYAGGRVYVTASGIYGTNLWAFDTERGSAEFRSRIESQWRFNTRPYSRRSFSPTVSDNKVYINGASEGGIYGFDGSNGDRLWFFSLNQYGTWTPAVDDRYVYAYANATPDDAKLSVINKSDGSIAFEIPDPGFPREIRDIEFTPMLGANNTLATTSTNNNILVAMGTKNNVLVAGAGRLVSFDVENRRIGWQKKSDSALYGQVSLAEGKVYAFNNGQVDILKESDGELIGAWVPPNNEKARGNIVVTNNLFLASTESATYAVDIQQRKVVWSVPKPGLLSLGHEGTLIIAGSTGEVTAIQLRYQRPQ